MNHEERNQANEQQNQHTEGQANQDQVKNTGSESNANHAHGHSDLTNRPSEGAVGNTHSSGISTKRSVTGSDFDGQVSPS